MVHDYIIELISELYRSVCCREVIESLKYVNDANFAVFVICKSYNHIAFHRTCLVYA